MTIAAILSALGANKPNAPNGAFLNEQQCSKPVANGLPVVQRVFIKG